MVTISNDIQLPTNWDSNSNENRAEKRKIRHTILEQRDHIDPKQRSLRSADICSKVHNFLSRNVRVNDDQNPQHIALYFAMNSEVDLSYLADRLLSDNWTLCFPLMVETTASDTPEPHCTTSHRAAKEMRFFAIKRDAFDTLKTSILNHQLHVYKRAELKNAGLREVAPTELDAVVVPLVAFDDQGFRLGYGGGNYDQFLPKLRDDAVIVGVAFKEQRVDEVPCEPHDLPLPSIIAG